jgi:HK97 family phage major capsid protein
VCCGDRNAALTGGNIDVDGFLMDIGNGIAPEKRTMIEGTGSLGGFSVPEAWYAGIFTRALEKQIAVPLCSTFQFGDSNMLHIPAVDDHDHSEGVAGPINAVWIGENQTNTPQDGRLRTIIMTMHKLALFIDASREAVEDGVTLEQQLQRVMVNAIAYAQDYAFLRGDGINKPQGVLDAASRVSVVRDTASQVKYADIVAMYSKMYPGGYDNAVWVASHSILSQLLTMVDAGNHNIWVPSVGGSISQKVPATLLGRPIYFTEKVPTLGSEGDLSFIDFSQYATGLKRGAIVERSNAPAWNRDAISFRIILRCDGAPLWDQSLTLADGTETSWCVTLGN